MAMTDFRKGFFVGLGVAAALLVAGIITSTVKL